MTRRLGPPVLALLLSSAPGIAQAGDNLDVDAWLERPGVRTLAVEFFASWCEPCRAAIPKWTALRAAYRDLGFRLVVVVTKDPGGCAKPGLEADEIICDEDGFVAEGLGVTDRLPSAFLWSWDGRLLVRKGHVRDVEAGLGRWLRRAHRADVVGTAPEGAGIDARALEGLARASLASAGKLVVVATKDERRRLDEIRAESLRARYAEDLNCEIGKEIPANALLEVALSGRPGAFDIGARLLEAGRGCLVAAATERWSAEDPRGSVDRALRELERKLRKDVELPDGATLVTLRVDGSRDGVSAPSREAVKREEQEPHRDRIETRVTPEPPRMASAPGGRRTILIDGSGDGGEWWFPQAPPAFDPAKEHQGKALADYLRNRGHEVVELPRNSPPSAWALERARVAIRFGAFRTYGPTELASYHRWVTQGGTLVIVAAGTRDGLANLFGVTFAAPVYPGKIVRWAEHPATAGLGPIRLVNMSTIASSPPGSSMLAWGESESSPGVTAPVLGTVPLGKGTLVFLGSSLIFVHVPQPLTDRFFDWLAPPG